VNERKTDREARWQPLVSQLACAVLASVSIGGCDVAADRPAEAAPGSAVSAPSSAPPPVATAAPADRPSAAAPVRPQQLPFSVEARDPSNAHALDPSILVPAACVLKDGLVTASGTFKAGLLVDPYARAGAVVELYVYSAGHEMVGYDGGKYMQRYQLAQVSEEHTFAINRPGPWIVSVPFGGQEPAASCEVAVQPMHRSTPVVSAPLASVAPTGVQHLAISKVSDANVRVESCVLDKGVVTATGSFRGDLPAIYNRVGSVLELYVYATPPAPGSPATQLADLTREQPLKMYANTNKSWAISGPIDTRLGQAARCEISVEETHNFEGAPNVY